MLNLIKTDKELTTLKLGNFLVSVDFCFTGAEDTKNIAEILKTNTAIQVLHLTMESIFGTLMVGGAHASGGGVKYVAEMLKINKVLVSFNMQPLYINYAIAANTINDREMGYLRDALSVNKTLLSLNIGKNTNRHRESFT